MITIKINHELIHKLEIQAITIDTEIIPYLPIGIIAVTPILDIDPEVTHQSIKDKAIKFKQTKKQLKTPQVSITQTITHYN